MSTAGQKAKGPLTVTIRRQTGGEWHFVRREVAADLPHLLRMLTEEAKRHAPSRVVAWMENGEPLATMSVFPGALAGLPPAQAGRTEHAPPEVWRDADRWRQAVQAGRV